MSSLVAYQGNPFISNYAGTKANDLIFAERKGAELKPYNVDVLVATPGFTNTELATEWDFSGLPLSPLDPQFVVRKVISKLGKKRVVVPGVLNWCLYIAAKYLQPRWLNTFSFGLVFKKVLRKKLRRKKTNIRIAS